MDFNVGLVDIYVAKKLVYIATLQLTLCVFRLCFGFVSKLLTCLQLIVLGSFVVTKLLNVATYM